MVARRSLLESLENSWSASTAPFLFFAIFFLVFSSVLAMVSVLGNAEADLFFWGAVATESRTDPKTPDKGIRKPVAVLVEHNL